MAILVWPVSSSINAQHSHIVGDYFHYNACTLLLWLSEKNAQEHPFLLSLLLHTIYSQWNTHLISRIVCIFQLEDQELCEGDAIYMFLSNQKPAHTFFPVQGSKLCQNQQELGKSMI